MTNNKQRRNTPTGHKDLKKMLQEVKTLIIKNSKIVFSIILIACVAITGNASVVTIITAAFGAIAISFLSPFVAIVDSIPPCVMGGVCMALYGFIAVSGLKMIQKVNLEENRNLFVVSVILIAGIGGLTVSFGAVTITNIACALILGILANLMLSKKDKKN